MKKVKYCPYRTNTQQLSRNDYEYSDGDVTVSQTVLMERQLLAICRGRECAAWRFGMCRIRRK